jgi:hypothetical protein
MKVRCSECKQEIKSKSRHDFVVCKCGESFVDGGKDYVRMGGKAEIYGKLIIGFAPFINGT